MQERDGPWFLSGAEWELSGESWSQRKVRLQRGSVEALSIPQSARDDISDKEMTVEMEDDGNPSYDSVT